MPFEGILGGVYKLADWIYTIIFSDLLWVLCNIPAIYVLFQLLLADSISVMFPLAFMLVLLLPFTFFPATIALFAVIHDLNNREDLSIVRCYWHKYRSYYKRSVKLGLWLTLLWAMLVVDFVYVHSLFNGAIDYIFLSLIFFALMVTLHMLTALINSENPTVRILALAKTAFKKITSRPLTSFSTIFILIVYSAICLYLAPILLALTIGSLTAQLMTKADGSLVV
ncbi:YesL family protein [Gracilibacillus sp. YIM 98692]|uniref:YesL family protein n=1 Tax=Gracilibacillus sp. YIM 98692 TaxID=2663532 RepID=UPI0013D89B28|nr:YesL family protein [Gracilibacillus sp. YIM 98692]